MKHILYLLFFVSLPSFSQSISGLVIDGDFNEPLPFANVTVKGQAKGSTTDIDGKFLIKIEPGTYTVVFSFIGYATTEISDVIVNENKDTFLQVTLKPESNQLDAVVIKTTSKKNSEASLLNLQQKSITLMDGLSEQAIKKAGDSDIAGAIKRVPGISVQGGKYIYVRGLGDRYSKTTLNSMELPGLDPDRNTIPLDIFPTNLIENIVVVKSASSDIGADFTGGTVDINLKDFSFNPQYNVSFSVGYNPDMHFNDNFITDERSSSDWLGKDDGYRDLPIDPNLDLKTALPIPLISADEANVLTENTKKLTKNMAPIQQTSDLNYSFGLSATNGFNLSKNSDASIGYIAALGYKSQTTYYDNFYRGAIFLPSLNQGLQDELIQDSELGRINTFLSTLLGVSFKSNKHKVSVNFINLQNGESNSQNLRRQTFIENPYYGEGSIITYTQRNLMSIPIAGKHTIGEDLFSINWRVAKSKSTLNDKDFKRAIFETNEDRTFFQISPNVIDAPSRLWRDLEEESLVGKLDFDFDFKTKFVSGILKFGASYIEKERDFNSKNFDIFFNETQTISSQILNGDPNAILKDENIWVQSPNFFDTTAGSYIRGGFERTNVYNSNSKNEGAYISSELKFSDYLKAVIGLRYETYQLRYSGEDLLGKVYENELFINDEDYYTNVNLIVSPNEKSNIRASFYQTTARPTFKEASTAYLVDPVTETIFLGNQDIESSYVDNYDLRYEYFGEKNQMFAISLFNKNFKNPIEIAVVSEDTPNDFYAINNESANVRGIEFEVRKNIFTFDDLRLNFNTNASFIDAKQRMNDEEFRSRQALAPDREIDRDRVLQGQSPYMINAGISLNETSKEIQAGFYYNVQGPTLEFVGIGGVPDIYSEPFHNLDFSASKVFNSEGGITKKLTLRINNILQEERQSYYIWNEEKAGLFRSFSPGIIFSVGASITF